MLKRRQKSQCKLKKVNLDDFQIRINKDRYSIIQEDRSLLNFLSNIIMLLYVVFTRYSIK